MIRKCEHFEILYVKGTEEHSRNEKVEIEIKF